MGVSSVILAGGRARRMDGEDKGMLPIEDSTFLEDKIQLIASHVSEIVIVTNEAELYDRHISAAAVRERPAIRIVTDLYPNSGVLAALYTGLLAAENLYAFVTTTDTPFLRTGLIELLVSAAADGGGETPDAVVPEWKGKIEPLCAVYSRRCIDLITPCIHRGEKKIRSFYSEARVRYLKEPEVAAVDPEGRSFININTRKDYGKYFTPEGRIKS